MLLQKLIQRQGEMSDLEFAKEIGVSRQMWNFVRTGVFPLAKARKVLLGVCVAFPDLAPEVLSLFAGDANNVTSRAS